VFAATTQLGTEFYVLATLLVK